MSAAATLSGSSPLSPSGPGPGEGGLVGQLTVGIPATSDLFEFLRRAELEQYYRAFVDDLKVTSPNQVKYCEDEDLMDIGMSRPQMRRLRKFFLRECPQTSLGKLRKRLSRSSSSRTHRATPPRHSPSSEEGGASIDPLASPAAHRSMIPSDQLELGKSLGEGEFGRVYQGVWRPPNGPPVQVAVKVLERLDSGTTGDFLKEVNNMHAIEHRNVVRLYGVAVEEDTLKMVTELASLRSLLECLKESGLRASLTVPVLCDFSEQIAEGMRYLESRRLIHRDLAARNILVFSKDRVKISDFGMSRALQLGKEYYQTNYNLNLKLPIAWCAPECINYLRFTSSSDVWAFGVTLWEMFSYGFQPWAGLTGEQILSTIDTPTCGRLDRPDLCPRTHYDLMQRCWRHEAKERPSFEEVVTQIGLLRPDICRCTEETTSFSGMLYLRLGESVVVLDKNPTLPEDSDESQKLWMGVTLGGPGNASGGVRGLFPSTSVRLVPQRTSASGSHGLRSGVISPAMKSRFNRREPGGVRRSARGRLRADMISLPQDDFRHTGHIGYDGSAFGDVAFIQQNLGGKNSDVARPSFKSSCISSRSVAGSSTLSSASSMISLNSGVTSVLGGSHGQHVRFQTNSKNGNSPTDSITTVSEWTGSQSTLTDPGDILPLDTDRPLDTIRSRDDTDLLADFSIPTETSLDFGGLMDDIFKSLNMDEPSSAPASNGKNSPVSSSNTTAPMSALAAATAVATGGCSSPDSETSSSKQSSVLTPRASLLSESEEDRTLTGACSSITASSTATSFDLILGGGGGSQPASAHSSRPPSIMQPASPAVRKGSGEEPQKETTAEPTAYSRSSFLSHPSPEKAPSKHSSSSTNSVVSSSSSSTASSAGSGGSPHQSRKSKLFPSLFSSGRSKSKGGSGGSGSGSDGKLTADKIGAPTISGPISAPIIEARSELTGLDDDDDDNNYRIDVKDNSGSSSTAQPIYAIPNKPYIRAKTLGLTGNSSSGGSNESVSSARNKASISKPMISAPISSTADPTSIHHMKSSTIAGAEPLAGGRSTAAFRVGGNSGARRPSASGGMSRSAFGPRLTTSGSGRSGPSASIDYSANSSTLSSMSSTLRSLRRHSSADKRNNDDDGGSAVAGLSIEQLGILSSSDTSDSFWGCDLTGAFSSKQIGSGRDSDEGENCYEELSDHDSTLTRHVLANGSSC